MPSKKDAIAAEFYQRYLNLVKEDDVVKALKKNSRQFKKFLEKIPKKKIDFAYAENKWTIKELLQHIIDAERVFSYRALTFARKDSTPLPGFDENNWAANAQTTSRKWNDLVKEFRALRKSTESLFEAFDENQLLSKGTASEKEINTLALGYICSGHVAHHINIIKERYL
jgi:hypothetical protein